MAHARTRFRFTSAPERRIRAMRQTAGTVYRQLLAQGFTPASIEAEAEDFVDTRRIAIVMVAQDGSDDPVIGVQYGGDFRAEEEWGIPEISKALRDGDWKRRLFTGNVEGHFYLGLHADQGVNHWRGQEHIDTRTAEALRRARLEAEWKAKSVTRGKTAQQLRTGLRDAGVEGPLPRTKVELEDMYRRIVGKVPERVSVGEFHYGDTLIMLPAAPVLEATLRILADAGKHLRMGGSSSPFDRGAVLFDDRDLTGETVEAMRAREDYLRRMNRKAEPIRKALAEKGFVYALTPGRRENGEDLFFLNYSPHDRRFKQQSGWFTLAQLSELHANDGWAPKAA